MPGGCRGRRAATSLAWSLLLSGGPTLLRRGLCFASPIAAPGGSVAAGDFWAINYLIPSSHVVFSPARSPPPSAQAPADGSGAGQGDAVLGSSTRGRSWQLEHRAEGFSSHFLGSQTASPLRASPSPPVKWEQRFHERSEMRCERRWHQPSATAAQEDVCALQYWRRGSQLCCNATVRP